MKNNEKKYYVYTMNLTILNIIASVLTFLLVVIMLILLQNKTINNSLILNVIILSIPCLIIHELLHAISYISNGANYKNITFGCHLEKGILCCLCKQNITKRNILISLLTPFTILGVIMTIIGIILKNPLIIGLGLINIPGCAGDILMFIELIRLKNYEFSEFDDPTSFAIYTNQNLSNKKLLGMKFVKETSTLTRTINKRIDINLLNTIILISLLIATIIILINPM